MKVNPLLTLPSTEELPCSDDTPVDNEDQNLLPNMLLFLLNALWADRSNWYFGVDMAIYHTTGANARVPVVPDAFLSLGVDRWKPSRQGRGRLSYVLWEENNIPPTMVLEMASHTPGGEYEEKMAIYARLGVLYYVIYNPEYWRRDQHQPFEVYKLVEDSYQQQQGEPYWMPEAGLAIGRYQTAIAGVPQEILAWFNQSGDRYLTSEERAEQANRRAEQAEQRAEQERQRAEQLAETLRCMGIDPKS
jgi:Uma2 family endonuclease